MNSSCKEAYSIFCEHNKGTNYKKVTYVLNVLNIYKTKALIPSGELNFLSNYIHFIVGGIKLTPYEINILICAISELKLLSCSENNNTLTFIFFSITRNFG